QGYQCLDAAHVFATGFSMGGYFSHHIGCYRGDVRAVGPHSGGTIASLSSCTTGHVPAIIFHETSDPLIAPGCDDPNSPAQPGVPPSATLWAQKNGCKSTYPTVLENGSGAPGSATSTMAVPPTGRWSCAPSPGWGTAGQGAAPRGREPPWRARPTPARRNWSGRSSRNTPGSRRLHP